MMWLKNICLEPDRPGLDVTRWYLSSVTSEKSLTCFGVQTFPTWLQGWQVELLWGLKERKFEKQLIYRFEYTIARMLASLSFQEAY